MARADFEGLQYVVDNKEPRAYIDKDLPDGDRCPAGEIVVAMLKAFGIRKRSDGEWERSAEPAHNRFEQLRASARQRHRLRLTGSCSTRCFQQVTRRPSGRAPAMD